MIKLLIQTMVCTSLFIALNASAIKVTSKNIYLCNQCDKSETHHLALQNPPLSGSHNVHIIDMQKDTAQAFQVTKAHDPKLGLIVYATPIASEPQISVSVVQMRTVLNKINELTVDGIAINALKIFHTFNSAFDVARTEKGKDHLEEVLAEYIINHVSVPLEKATPVLGLQMVNQILHIPDTRQAIPLVYSYPVKFTDDSTYNFRIKNTQLNAKKGEVKLDIEAIRTSGKIHNVRIPEGSTWAYESVEIPSKYVKNWFAAAAKAGIKISTKDIAEELPTGENIRLVCSTNQSCEATKA